MGLNTRTVAWLGPSPENLQADFESFFATTMRLTGDAFLVATPREIYRDQQRLASARGHALRDVDPNDTPPAVDLAKVYTPGQLMRLKDYESFRADSGNPDAWYADLEQSAKNGASTPGQVVPSLLTHGTIHSWTAKRALLVEELFVAHGYNLFPERTGCPELCKIAPCLSTLQVKNRKLLLGNGWHLPMLSSWMFYILSQVIKRPSHTHGLRAEMNFLKRGGTTAFARASSSASNLDKEGDADVAVQGDATAQAAAAQAADIAEDRMDIDDEDDVKVAEASAAPAPG